MNNDSLTSHVTYSPGLQLVFAALHSDVINMTNASVTSLDLKDTSYQGFYDAAQFVTGLILYPILCLYGLVGNVCILIVLGQKSMQTSTNVYLSALAVSDIIKLLNDLLYFLTILLLQVSPKEGKECYGILYPYAHFIFSLSVPVSAWLTVSVAVERYILVCHPTRSKTLTTIPRAKYISAACFAVFMPLAIPSAMRYRTITVIRPDEYGRNVTELDVELTDLWKNENFTIPYNWIQIIIRSIIPLLILIFMNAFIINALRKTRANKKMASRNKITVMLIIVIIFFLVCTTPDCIMSTVFNAGYAESEDNLVKGIREITDMLLVVNAALNFTLYMVFNKIFRDKFLQLFCHRCVNINTNNQDNRTYQPIENPKNGTAGTAV